MSRISLGLPGDLRSHLPIGDSFRTNVNAHQYFSESTCIADKLQSAPHVLDDGRQVFWVCFGFNRFCCHLCHPFSGQPQGSPAASYVPIPPLPFCAPGLPISAPVPLPALAWDDTLGNDYRCTTSRNYDIETALSAAYIAQTFYPYPEYISNVN